MSFLYPSRGSGPRPSAVHTAGTRRRVRIERTLMCGNATESRLRFPIDRHISAIAPQPSCSPGRALLRGETAPPGRHATQSPIQSGSAAIGKRRCSLSRPYRVRSGPSSSSDGRRRQRPLAACGMGSPAAQTLTTSDHGPSRQGDFAASPGPQTRESTARLACPPVSRAPWLARSASRHRPAVGQRSWRSPRSSDPSRCRPHRRLRCRACPGLRLRARRRPAGHRDG